MIEYKSKLININCSFKKLKKIISLLKKYNFKKILNFIDFNNSKSFTFLKTLFRNVILSSKNTNLKIINFYVTKGKKYKKIFPRAKGRIDFKFRRLSNIYLKVKNL